MTPHYGGASDGERDSVDHQCDSFSDGQAYLESYEDDRGSGDDDNDETEKVSTDNKEQTGSAEQTQDEEKDHNDASSEFDDQVSDRNNNENQSQKGRLRYSNYANLSSHSQWKDKKTKRKIAEKENSPVATKKDQAGTSDFYTHKTISEDQSSGSGYSKRLLHAVFETHVRTFGKDRDTIPSLPVVAGDLRTGIDGAITAILSVIDSDPRVRLEHQSLSTTKGILRQQIDMPGESAKRMLQAPVSTEEIPAPESIENFEATRTLTGTEPSTVSPTHTSGKRNTQELMEASDAVGSFPEDPLITVNNLQSLQEYISQLQARAESLEQRERQREPSAYQVLYRIMSSKQTNIYFDHPAWVTGERGSRVLQSKLPLSNFALFLEKHRDLAFIVYKDYNLSDTSLEPPASSIRGDSIYDVVPSVKHTSESMFPVTRELASALKSVLKSNPSFDDLLRMLNLENELPAPYLFIYHCRDVIHELTEEMSGVEKRQFLLLYSYVEQEYGSEYRAADSSLAANRISSHLVKYLFKPDDVLVCGKGDSVRAYISKSWPTHPVIKEAGTYTKSEKQTKTERFESVSLERLQAKRKKAWNINAWSWEFDGTFRRVDSKIRLEIEGDTQTETSIQDLEVRPMSKAGQDVLNRLHRRGEMFWRCRFRHLVSYTEKRGNSENRTASERYMIDLETYKSLHPSHFFSASNSDEILEPEVMQQENAPDEDFTLLLPLTIKGFSLERKKWVDLRVDQIHDVEWNKEAFKTLVLQNKTKSLIQALISSHLSPEKSTDLISGKGNGLVLLLHVGPGTGKTLTAESVAEIAEKPLYRVTCGDVGTDPQEVEKYLESVLHLGKIWGCVVLLDEADVFLEQRSLEDLKRNALVSVFLRQLEYYDGILILTSNRVGTFDEAFKSRIQLALHYANLDKYQRLKIWEIFINRLENLGGEKIDLDDLRDHLEELAETKMNGRQIRNAITTARQYVLWNKYTLNYEHLKDVIEISGRFDQYLDKLHGGYTQDQLAEDEGIRLSKGL